MRGSDENHIGLRCEPGDLAIVSRCGNPRFLGMLVRVIGPHESADRDWSVEILGSPTSGSGYRSGRIGTYRTAAVKDWNLTPIPGREHLDQVRHVLELPVDLQMF